MQLVWRNACDRLTARDGALLSMCLSHTSCLAYIHMDRDNYRPAFVRIVCAILDCDSTSRYVQLLAYASWMLVSQALEFGDKMLLIQHINDDAFDDIDANVPWDTIRNVCEHVKRMRKRKSVAHSTNDAKRRGVTR